MSGPPARDKELFEKVILKWKQQPDPTAGLTLNQIASLSLGKGNSKNAAIVGRTLADFREYFDPPGEYGYKWKVRWQKVAQDYPDLLESGSQRRSTPAQQTSPLDGMKRALQDEIRAVREDADQHPVRATVTPPPTDLGDGSFLYEAFVEMQTDAELPIPEGVKIRLLWPPYVEPGYTEATLLSYDALESLVFIEVERPFSERQVRTSFRILPCLEELIRALEGQLEKLASRRDCLSWRILDGSGLPQSRPWGLPLQVQHLDETQARAVESCLNSDISFLWGPPGTGKTYTLGHLMAAAALAGRKVIATAISNVAVDQMASHLVRALEQQGVRGSSLLEQGSILRFGHPRLPEVTGEKRLFPNKERIQQLRKALHEANQRHRQIPQHDARARAISQKLINDLRQQLRTLTKESIDHAQVVLTTAVQTCIESAISETAFDIVVIDEASMMSLPHVASVGLLARERLIVTGDFRQLAPIALARSAAAYDWLHKDAFAQVGIGKNLSHPGLSMLRVQRRMHPTICQIVNAPFYRGELRTATESRKSQACSFPPLPGTPAILVAVLPEDGSEVVQTEAGSRLNKKTAEVTARLARRYLELSADCFVGIIAPYRDHIAMVKRLLKQPPLTQAMARRLKVGTVHAFQGSEADIIIWDLVDSRHRRIGKLFHGESGNRLVNVAISRAQGKLVVVGDPDTFWQAPSSDMVQALRPILTKHFNQNSGNVVYLHELAALLSHRVQ